MVMVLNSTMMYIPNESSYFASVDAVSFVFLFATLLAFVAALFILVVFIGLALPPALIALCVSTVTKKGPSATSIVEGAVYSVIVFSLFAFSILGGFALLFTLFEGFINQAVDWSDLFIKFLLLPPDLSASFQGSFPAFTITVILLRLGKVVFITGPLVVDLIAMLQGLVLFIFCIDLDSKYGSPYDDGETLEAYQELETQRDVISKLYTLIKRFKEAQDDDSKEQLEETRDKLKEALDKLHKLRKQYRKARERSDLKRLAMSKKQKETATKPQKLAEKSSNSKMQMCGTYIVDTESDSRTRAPAADAPQGESANLVSIPDLTQVQMRRGELKGKATVWEQTWAAEHEGVKPRAEDKKASADYILMRMQLKHADTALAILEEGGEAVLQEARRGHRTTRASRFMRAASSAGGLLSPVAPHRVPYDFESRLEQRDGLGRTIAPPPSGKLQVTIDVPAKSAPSKTYIV